MAAKKAETVGIGGAEPSTNQQIVGLLTSIFQEVRTQVTVPALKGKAEAAFQEFQRIKAGLALRQVASVELTADKTNINSGDVVTLSWKSTNADKVSIDNGVGIVEPAAGGSIQVTPTATTTFTATATGSCSTPTASVTVTVDGVDVDFRP